jgi:hypothetical protein
VNEFWETKEAAGMVFHYCRLCRAVNGVVPHDDSCPARDLLWPGDLLLARSDD